MHILMRLGRESQICISLSVFPESDGLELWVNFTPLFFLHGLLQYIAPV